MGIERSGVEARRPGYVLETLSTDERIAMNRDATFLFVGLGAIIVLVGLLVLVLARNNGRKSPKSWDKEGRR